MPLLTRSYVARYFSMALDGEDSPGLLASIEGGGIKGELIAQQVGGQPHRFKHINNPTVEPVTVKVGMDMSDAFYDWVALSWEGECARRNGHIYAGDYKRQAQFEWEFQEALILETAMPTLDAASKEAAYMNIKFQAETATNKILSGGPVLDAISPLSQKLWHCSNFRAEIDAINTDKISKIDSFTVKQNVKPMACGAHWMYQIEPTSLEIPNLTFYLPQAHAGDFFKWHEDFVIKGKNKQADEKGGAVVMLDPTRTKELLRITLSQVGIVNIVSEKADTSQEAIRRVKVELYVEGMVFNYPGTSG